MSQTASNLRILNKYYIVNLIRTEAETLPFQKNKFDFILTANYLTHLSAPQRIIKELERILSPQGTMIIKDFNRKTLRKMQRTNNPLFLPHRIQYISLFEIADYFDKEEKYVNCLREEFDTTLVITNGAQKI